MGESMMLVGSNRLLFTAGLLLSLAPRATLCFKFVSIGSDDWGRWSGHGPAWPDNATRQVFWDEGLWLSGGEPSRATAETEQDLYTLYDFLDNLNEGVPRAHRVVLSPFWVVGVCAPPCDASPVLLFLASARLRTVTFFFTQRVPTLTPCATLAALGKTPANTVSYGGITRQAGFRRLPLTVVTCVRHIARASCVVFGILR
jgi:hypothetical protein